MKTASRPHRALRGLSRRNLLPGVILALLLLGGAPGPAQAEDPPSPEEVRAKSLPLRTALHHDPTLGSPLERLLDLYRKAGRVDELVAVYRAHVQRYPTDGSARIVYVRLLLATNDPEGPREVRTALEQHPESGYLHYLMFSELDERGDPRALAALDQAIAQERLPARKRRWVDLLLTKALREDRRDLAVKHLSTLADLMGGGAEARLKAARKMNAFGYHERAFKELEEARAASPSPELGVEIELLAANLEVSLGRRSAAAKRLDALLGRLTADYWRRSEILRRRARLVASSEERDAMLGAAKARVDAAPQDESAALDYARLLSGFERHRAALAALHAAGKRLSASIRIETEILASYARLRDESGRVAYLEERLALAPKRQDLIELHLRGLFLLGRKGKALKLLDALLAPLPPNVQVNRLLESARFLRTEGMQHTAADLYERVVALVPGRLDIRREWAECHLADGDRASARRVLAAAIPTDTPRDVFLDLMQMLTRQFLYAEARRALQTRIADHPDDLDVHLALIDVEGSLGYGSSGAEWIKKARTHADTPARYRRWLMQSTRFHLFYDNEVAFLDAEQQRIEADAGDWTDRRAGRLEAFTEVSAEYDRITPISALLRSYLALEIPSPIRVRLRRKLAGMLEEAGRGWFTRDEGHLGSAADELRRLAKEDAEFRDAYNARLALIHIARKRPDLARPLLTALDVRKLNQPRMLERLVRAYTDLNDGERVLACLERLTVVAAAERNHWEDWIAALTASGDELKLRSAIRRLLRGVPRLRISHDTQSELEAHLSDSYWRSIGTEIGLRSEAGYLEALALLDQTERITAADDLPLWITWTRAWLQHALERSAERDEALGELDRMMARRRERAIAEVEAQAAKADEPPSEEELADDRADALARLEHIHFPDGLGASWRAARSLLTRPTVVPTRRGAITDRAGPGGRLHARWVFETEGDSAVTAILPLDAEHVLIADSAGDLYSVERTSGKLVWHRPQAFATLGAGGVNNQAPVAPVRVPLRGPDGSFFLPMPGHVVCMRPDGTKRWEAGVGASAGLTTPLALASDERALYTYDSASGEVAALRLDDGKLLWHRRLVLKAQAAPAAQGEGIALSGDRILVYGPRTAILDIQDGRVLWTFEPDRVRRVPIALEEPGRAFRSLWGRSRRRPFAAHAGGAAAGASPPHAGPTPTPFSPFQGRSMGLSGRHLGGPSLAQLFSGPRASPLARPPAGAVFLTPAGRSAQQWSPKSQPGTSTAVVAPAVRWAAPLGAGESRLGLLMGKRLILARNGVPQPNKSPQAGALLLDMDLPMFARTAAIAGTPVAVHGPRLALLQPGRLVVWHVERGTQTHFDLSVIAGGRTHYGVQAAQEGGFLYLTGPGGVLCVHIISLNQVFHAPWPKGTRPAQDDTLSVVQHRLRGMTAYRNPGRWSSMLPAVGMVGHGTLYTVSDPWRVVALEEQTTPPIEPAGPKDSPAKGGDDRDR